jgi:hypothetical protein
VKLTLLIAATAIALSAPAVPHAHAANTEQLMKAYYDADGECRRTSTLTAPKHTTPALRGLRSPASWRREDTASVEALATIPPGSSPVPAAPAKPSRRKTPMTLSS